MVSAIRVSGSSKLRTLIGRAKESRGIVEAEVMSSTSPDVCELWNGKGVARVLGSPVLLQLVYVPKVQADPLIPEPEIYTFAEAVKKGMYKNESNTDSEGPQALESHPPNLSLNVSMKPINWYWQCIFAVFGAGAQTSVVVFAWLIQYQYNWPGSSGMLIPGYAFHIFLAGTLILFCGMLLCARIIERSTDEIHWRPERGGLKPEVIWLQQGGQTVGDQLFESFARRSKDTTTIITSMRPVKKPRYKSGQWRNFPIWFAILASFSGFVIQFVGLRATHPYVTALQLAAILVMTAIRSFCSIDRRSRNDIEDPSRVDGHELDWLAKTLKDCGEWGIATGVENQGYSEPEDQCIPGHM